MLIYLILVLHDDFDISMLLILLIDVLQNKIKNNSSGTIQFLYTRNNTLKINCIKCKKTEIGKEGERMCDTNT